MGHRVGMVAAVASQTSGFVLKNQRMVGVSRNPCVLILQLGK